MNTTTNTEQFEMELEVIAGVIADLDEDNIKSVDALPNLLGRFTGNGLPEEISSEIRNCLEIVEGMKSGEIEFDDGYGELAESFDRARTAIAGMNGPTDDEHEGAAANVAPSSLSSEDRDELELQVDVISGLLEDSGAITDHVYTVIQNLFEKIAHIAPPDTELAVCLKQAGATLDSLI